MPNAFSSEITDLASTFAAAVLRAIRGASVEEIRALAAEPAAPVGARSASPGKGSAPTRKVPRTPAGRLHRRSPAEIARALAKVVALVKEHKGGLRAEQIRKKLGMQAKEMPRVLKEGLEQRSLRSKGEKRSTTYSAA